MSSIASFEQTPLLEVRTEAGAVYLCPSRLQRMRLQWTFRHFHVLPPQVLSRHDQRLIERLSQSAVVTPSLPVASEAILGIVEQAGASSSAYEADLDPPSMQDAWRDQRQGQCWVALGAVAAAAIGVTVLLASVHGIARHKPALPVVQAGSRRQLLPSGSAMTSLLAVAPEVAPVPFLQPQPLQTLPPALVPAENSRGAAPRKPSATLHADSNAVPAEPVTAQVAWVTDLPPGHFAHPVVAQRNLAGEVDLQARIAPNGSVKEVTVLRGDPQLAAAGMRAVLQWRYSPFAVHGTPVEAETRIKMNFFGADAVSISSAGK